MYLDIFSDQILHLYVNNFQTNTILWSDFGRIQSKPFKNEGHIYVQSSLSLNLHEEDNNILTTITHEINASSSISSHVIKDYHSICNMERDTIFSHVVLDIVLFYCNMMTTSRSNVINSKLQIEGHNEVIDFKVIPNCHFVPSQLINDDVVLKNSFFTESISQLFNHIIDKIHFSYNHHEISVFSMNALQTSCHFQHNFYDPIFY